MAIIEQITRRCLLTFSEGSKNPSYPYYTKADKAHLPRSDGASVHREF